jgi:dihydroorotate dehydrogenase (NAD+) catalytic subunit
MAEISLHVQLGRLSLPNPILVASGTFGYAREMEHLVDLNRLGGILPKTVTQVAAARKSALENGRDAAGLLNSIGLDNDGIDAFIAHHLPYLSGLAAPVIVSIAGRTPTSSSRWPLSWTAKPGVAALELNISCPNVRAEWTTGRMPSPAGG